jgi:Raf kinase inhibitor-like YbhB/YbcL family protein
MVGSRRCCSWALPLLLCTAGTAAAFEVKSSSVSNGNWDKKYIADSVVGCDGGNVSPAVAWKDAPPETNSFGLTIYDPDAPTGSGWWHWQVWNIPASVTAFAEGEVPHSAVQGKGDLGRVGYLGPCPPPGSGVHHYVFTVYALKVDKLEVDPASASGAFVGYNLNGNAIAKASVTYEYQR